MDKYDEVRRNLKEIVPVGLVMGLGSAFPGQLCIEAAVCLALGEPHGDRPTCVAPQDRDFAVRINDAFWSTDAARAEALLPLALAQLGTQGTDRSRWVSRVIEGTIRRVVPAALRAVVVGEKGDAREDLLHVAQRCEDEGTGAAAHAAALRAMPEAAAHAAYRAAHAAAYAAKVGKAGWAGRAATAAGGDRILKMSVEIALEAYAAEGR